MRTARLTKLTAQLRTPESRKKLFDRAVSGLYGKSAVRLAARVAFPPKSPKQWVFLLGCYNSGTTILRDVLGAHPEVSTMPREGVKLTDLFPTPEHQGWFRMTHRCAPGSLIPSTDNATDVRQTLVVIHRLKSCLARIYGCQWCRNSTWEFE